MRSCRQQSRAYEERGGGSQQREGTGGGGGSTHRDCAVVLVAVLHEGRNNGPCLIALLLVRLQKCGNDDTLFRGRLILLC
jgi:hypothetical protein